MSPSLGWLQAFLCAADHLNYELAAVDLGLNSAQRVERRVEKLEVWLRKILIMNDPIELNEGDGIAFIEVAWAALKSFGSACPAAEGLITGASRAPLAKHISKINLEDLQRFLTVVEDKTYKGAAFRLGLDTSNIHRSIKSLERASGRSLFSGHGLLTLTHDGENLRQAAEFIISSLISFRAVVPDDYDPAVSRAHNTLESLKIKQTSLRFLEDSIVRTGKKQRGTVRLEQVRESLNMVSAVISSIESKYGSPPNRSAEDIDMSSIMGLPKANDRDG